MTPPEGAPFDLDRALAGVDALLAGPVPAGGPPEYEIEPYTGAALSVRGEGYAITELWSGHDLLGVYEAKWQAAQDLAYGHGDELLKRLDARWGAHRDVGTYVAVMWSEGDPDLPPLYEELRGMDALGTLHVWGPVRAPGGDADRWVGISVNQIDGDRPFFLTAVVADRPIEELEEGGG
ncbi:hypothetical protein OG897_21530 [Streptomyces sp. NBC_00237]|uniref:hypothetical protein n=1 Tax=Streptomyces sp. NBC_00237 TaxID=2975687 RepID=UPI00224CA50A|nr:hypothetical protein [Streptomyces sp. NBC_00237]MCX5204020.1 hypothetical protein [Streptomyces sp. NBC_00237]